MERLRIGNKEDIRKVIEYERSRGYDRYSSEQHELKEYEVEYELLTRGTIIVEAFTEDLAYDVAERELKMDIVDFDEIEFTDITELSD